MWEGKTPAQVTKGEHSMKLSEMSRLCNTHVSCLKRYFATNPEKFECLMLGAVARREEYR